MSNWKLTNRFFVKSIDYSTQVAAGGSEHAGLYEVLLQLSGQHSAGTLVRAQHNLNIGKKWKQVQTLDSWLTKFLVMALIYFVSKEVAS